MSLFESPSELYTQLQQMLPQIQEAVADSMFMLGDESSFIPTSWDEEQRSQAHSRLVDITLQTSRALGNYEVGGDMKLVGEDGDTEYMGGVKRMFQEALKEWQAVRSLYEDEESEDHPEE